MNKLLRVIVVVLMVMAFVLAGCAKQEEATEETTTAVEQEETAAVEATEEATEEPAEEEATEEIVQASGEPIKIGLITPITGYAADYGKFIVDGVEYAAQVINESGGVLGRPIEIVMEDEIGDQQSSINAMMKLFNMDDLTVILGSSGNSNCLAVVDTVLDYEIPVIMNGGNITFDQHQNPWVWQTRMSDAVKGEMYAKVITDVMATENLAILHMTDAAGGPRDRTETALKDIYGMEAVINLTYNQNTETNYDNYILQILNSGADGLFAIGQQEIALIMKSAASLELDIPKVGPSVVTQSTTIENAGDAAEGWYAVTEWTNELTGDAREAFIAGYTEYAGRGPSWAGAVYYDSVFIACKAIELAGSTDHAAVNAAFEQITDMSGMISTFSFHEDHTFADSILLTQIEDGKAVVVEEMTP